MDLGLKGKVAVVTGAASQQGVGRAIASVLAREGVDVAVTDIIFEGVQATAQAIRKEGANVLALKVDQSKYDEVQKAVVQIREKLGSIDILVNNAALTGNMAPAHKMTAGAWENEIDVNLNGIFYWTREVLPVMFQNKWGRVINISSMGGVIGAAGLPAYCASKGGMIAFTKTLALEVAKKGVTVNTVSLGIIDSGVYSKGFMDPTVMKAIKRRLPMGRMGEPGEVAELVVFLASMKAAYIQGANIMIDGGITLGISKDNLGIGED